MPKKYPPLTPQEVIDILEAWGFVFDRWASSHKQYVGIVHGLRRLVSVDMHYAQFDPKLLKSMIDQSGTGWEGFYCATKQTAKKINQTYKAPNP